MCMCVYLVRGACVGVAVRDHGALALLNNLLQRELGRVLWTRLSSSTTTTTTTTTTSSAYLARDVYRRGAHLHVEGVEHG